MVLSKPRDTLSVMTKFAPNEVVHGSPRTLPTVLLCQADINFCGRHWIANSWGEYDEKVKARYAHETLCGGRPNAAGLISSLNAIDRQALLVAKR